LASLSGKQAVRYSTVAECFEGLEAILDLDEKL
jgi:hypothetical protein